MEVSLVRKSCRLSENKQIYKMNGIITTTAREIQKTESKKWK